MIELRMNLISLGALHKLGCKISPKFGGLKFRRCAMILMKGKKIGNLYILEGNTITGNGAVTKNDQTNSLNLWYERLGHMSEQGLIELIKINLIPNVEFGKIDFYEDYVFGK